MAVIKDDDGYRWREFARIKSNNGEVIVQQTPVAEFRLIRDYGSSWVLIRELSDFVTWKGALFAAIEVIANDRGEYE